MLTEEEAYVSYRVKLNHFRVTDHGAEVVGRLRWNEEKTVVAFESDEILPPQRELKANVLITWQELINSTWTDLDATETREITFTTGEAPDYIPEHNIAYSYPVRNQYAFLQDEHDAGYLHLVRGQSYLFEATDPQGRSWEYAARFTTANASSCTDKTVTYRNKTITFAVPPGLTNEAVCQLAFLKKPTTVTQVDENVVRTKSEIEVADANNVMTAERNIEGTLAMADTETLYSYSFRTSQYNTFSAKVDAMYGQQTTAGIVEDIIIYKVGVQLNMPEVWGETELGGTHGQPPLVKMHADLTNTWFANHMHPLLYEHYPVNSNVTFDWRNPSVAGVPPIYSVVPTLSVAAPALTSEQRASGSAPRMQGNIELDYQLPTYTYKDHDNLRAKAINRYVGVRATGIPTGAKRLMYTDYQNFLDGTYQVKLTYQLPGKQEATTTKTIRIQW